MASRQRYQQGSLSKRRRADGRQEWILRYRITVADGRRVQRHAVIGTVAEYPTKPRAQVAADRLRLAINNQLPEMRTPTIGDLAWHFKDHELAEGNPRRSWSTKSNYRCMIHGYILPRWEKVRLMDVKTVQVEAWLDSLSELANPSKQRIKTVFSVLFGHAQRYEFVPIGHNPIKLVRQSGKRRTLPDILEVGEVHGLWFYSAPRERAAISLEYGNGFRRSEVFALKWSDIDFLAATVLVTRAIVHGHLGEVKTEISRKLVPLHPLQLEDLLAWRRVSPYPGDDDWVFASERCRGQRPLWPDIILRHYIRPLALRLGISKRVGWHTFRRTFSTLLKANGEEVKTVQELMRHANPTTTLMLYAQAIPDRVRSAQGKVVELVRSAPVPALVVAEEQEAELSVY